MPKAHSPRKGSMQFWPRKRAKRAYARVRTYQNIEDAVPLGFAGYKVGMTHIAIIDNRPASMSKGQEIIFPATIIECPPLKVMGVRFYNKKGVAQTEVWVKTTKELQRKITPPKKEGKKFDDVKQEEYENLTLLAHTQPKLTGIGKKKPELFELPLGGNKESKIKFAKEILGKEIYIKDVLKEGQLIDIHAITKGKGFQGPVKRFGVKIRSHKAEKTKRGPGSLGGWSGQQHVMYRVAHAGQMGYHQRIDYNKWILKISDKAEEINPSGGFVRYGLVKNQYVLVKGSIPGPNKRLIRMNHAIRPNKKIPQEAPSIEYISVTSRQGN